MQYDIAFRGAAKTASNLELQYNGKVIPLFTYAQLEGLALNSLKARVALLKEALDEEFEFPPITSNNIDELIRYVLCVQSFIISNLEGSDALDVTRDHFAAPDTLLAAERLCPTTPPRLRSRDAESGFFNRFAYSAKRESAPSSLSRHQRSTKRISSPRTKVKDSKASGVSLVVNNVDLVDNATRPASLFEVQINEETLPLYSYEQLQYLNPRTLATRVRELEDVVGRLWDLPKPLSHRFEDLLIYILCIQAQVVAFQSEEDLDPRDVLVNGFGAPHEWAHFTETRHNINQPALDRQSVQRRHYTNNYEDHITAKHSGLQPKKQYAQESERDCRTHSARRKVDADHFQGEFTDAIDQTDLTMQGYLPKCIGHGKHHIELRPDFDEPEKPVNTRRHSIVPDDHLLGGFAKKESGKNNDVVGQGHGLKRIDTFLGGQQRRSGGCLLLSGSG